MPNSMINIKKRTFAATSLLIGAIIICNVVLILRNFKLRETLMQALRPKYLEVGTSVPAFHGDGIDGGELTLEYGIDPRKTILLVFSPKCEWCSKNLPNWQAIIGGVSPKLYRIIGISTSVVGLPEYIKDSVLNRISIIARAQEQDIRAYRLNGTPLTIAIDNRGKVEKVWPGPFQNESLADAEKYFSIRLPGLKIQ